MRQFLHRHKIVLNALGPVFIGDGRELVKREYVLNKRERKVTVIDQSKFFQYLTRTKKRAIFCVLKARKKIRSVHSSSQRETHPVQAPWVRGSGIPLLSRAAERAVSSAGSSRY